MVLEEHVQYLKFTNIFKEKYDPILGRGMVNSKKLVKGLRKSLIQYLKKVKGLKETMFQT